MPAAMLQESNPRPLVCEEEIGQAAPDQIVPVFIDPFLPGSLAFGISTITHASLPARIDPTQS
jgi:hypothetical protein